MAASTSILNVIGLGKQVNSPEGQLILLDAVDFSIDRGDVVAITGASGSGKSTLLGLLAGLDTPTRGSVQIEGIDLFTLDEDGRARIRAEKIGFVFQSFQLLPALTALENVLLPMELTSTGADTRQAERILQRVGLQDRLHHYPGQLSGGEQQRVAIARAFVLQPDILFADEPTGNLDQHTGERIIELLLEINRENGATLVLVTHDVALAARCDHRLHLDAGHLVSGQ